MRALKICLWSLLASCTASVVACFVGFVLVTGGRWLSVPNLTLIVVAGSVLGAIGSVVVSSLAVIADHPARTIAVGATIFAVISGFGFFLWVAWGLGT